MDKSIRGEVEHIIYRSEDGGFAVLRVLTDDGRMAVTGNVADVSVGERVEFFGSMTDHPTYGTQFNADFFEPLPPESRLEILKYLSSGNIKGVGPATARQIVKKFGEESLEVIKNRPDELCAVKGISADRAKSISENFRQFFGARETVALLRGYSISREDAVKAYKTLGPSAAEMITENPYILCGERLGVPFDTAEKVAAGLGYPSDGEHRICAGTEHILRHNLGNGHTCLPESKLCAVARQLLNVSEDAVFAALEKLTEQKRIIIRPVKGGENMLFLPDQYYAERYAAGRIILMLNSPAPGGKVTPGELDKLEKKQGVKYAELQKKAITEAVDNRVFILTGGPGTGKTTALNGILSLMESRDLKVLLAAPTGRAAKRMQELCGREAATLHRLLEVEWSEEDRQVFKKNEREPLRCDAVIVDEVSMVDSLLFEALLKALPLDGRLILVGDSDQLPSVGAGNVLYDLIRSGLIPTVCLRDVFRQAAESLIVSNAHAVIHGEQLTYNLPDGDFFMVKSSDPAAAAQTVVDLVTRRLPQTYGFGTGEIQVLCPSRKLTLGTVSLNNLLQSSINPSAAGVPEIVMKDFCLRAGDRVMQVKNNYDIAYKRDNGEQGFGVFNGDTGVLESIDPSSGSASVRFDDRVAEYFGDELIQLEPAYAITIHKSQGSEYDCVVLPLLDVPQKLRYRNLLYTAITRAKKLLCIVGSDGVCVQMTANDRRTLRYTGLEDMLNEAADGLDR